MNVLVVHLTHPEGYPPAFNAINCISKRVNNLTILTTDTLPTNWRYDDNVSLDLIEGEHDRFKYAKRSRFKKVKTYFEFVKRIIIHLKKSKIDLIIVYDDVPFLFYLLASFFVRKETRIWFHSHDVYPVSAYKKFSINWLAAIAVQKYFHKIHFFSLPAIERIKMFPIGSFDGQTFFIPNYPSTNVIKRGAEIGDFKNTDKLKIAYPGSPSIKNGFEDLLKAMKDPINGRILELYIIGESNPEYMEKLTKVAQKQGVDSQLFFVGRVPYVKMTDFIKQFHVGWAVYKPLDISVATAGTSSNKIYEFLANGLPIIVFNNEHHHEHLGKSEVVFFTDLSLKSIQLALKGIMKDMASLQIKARNEFLASYQFEFEFNRVIGEVVSIVKKDNNSLCEKKG